jgi:hypothetical protein
MDFMLNKTFMQLYYYLPKHVRSYLFIWGVFRENFLPTFVCCSHYRKRIIGYISDKKAVVCRLRIGFFVGFEDVEKGGTIIA